VFFCANGVKWHYRFSPHSIAPKMISNRPMIQREQGGQNRVQKVTKGNRFLASGALSGANDESGLIARGAFIYQAKRGKTHSLDPTGVDGARTRNPRRDRAVL
jgi:hypothetical protein